MNSLIGRVIYVFFKNKDTYPTFDNYENEEWETINALLIILCLVKDIGRMKFFSLFGIIALFYTIIVLVIESPFYWKHYLNHVYEKNDKSTHANWIDISKAFNSNLDFFLDLLLLFSLFQIINVLYLFIDHLNQIMINL